MENKMLETIVSHILDMKQDMASMKQGMAVVAQRLESIEEGQKKLHVDQRDIEIKVKSIDVDIRMSRLGLEQDVSKKVIMLFDAPEMHKDDMQKVLACLDRIESRLTMRDAKIYGLESKPRTRKKKVAE